MDQMFHLCISVKIKVGSLWILEDRHGSVQIWLSVHDAATNAMIMQKDFSS